MGGEKREERRGEKREERRGGEEERRREHVVEILKLLDESECSNGFPSLHDADQSRGHTYVHTHTHTHRPLQG